MRLQVGAVQEEWGGGTPGDFDCFKRAENIPALPNCPLSARATLLADSDKPAADAAAETAAALAATSAVLVQARSAGCMLLLPDQTEQMPGCCCSAWYSAVGLSSVWMR